MDLDYHEDDDCCCMLCVHVRGRRRTFTSADTVLSAGIVPGRRVVALFSGFRDLNSPDTFPLIQMATFKPFGGSGGGDFPGNSFSGFGDLNSPDTFPLVQIATFKAFRSSCGEDPSERLQSIMLRLGYKQSVHLSIKYIK